MMLSLVLHASHQQQPEKVLVCIVSAAYQLVIDVRHLRVLSKSNFSFMIANQDVGRIESSDEAADDKVNEVRLEEVEGDIVGGDQS